MNQSYQQKILVSIDQFVISLSNFIVAYSLAYHLTPSDFGLYSLYLSIMFLLLSVLESILFQPYQIYSHQQKEFTIKSMIKSVNMILVSFQFLFFIFLVIKSNISHYTFGFMIFVFSSLLYEMNRKLLLTEMSFNKLLIQDIITHVLRVLFVYLFLNYSINNNIFYVLALAFIFSLFISKRNYLLISFKYIKDYYRLGQWIFYTAIVFWISTQSSLFILEYFNNLELVGVFTALLVPFGIIRIVNYAGQSFLLPRISKKIAEYDKDTMFRYFMSEAKYFYIIVSFLYLLLWQFSDVFLQVFYAGKFNEYLTLFEMLILYSFLQAIDFYLSMYLKIIDRSKAVFVVNRNVLFFMLPIIIFLIYTHDIYGLAFGIILFSMTKLFGLIFKLI